MKQLLLFVFITFGFINQAQIKYEFGPEGAPAKDLRFNEVLGGSESFFYIHKISTEGKGLKHFIQKMDRKNLLPVDTKEMILEEKDYTMEVNRLVCYDDELTAFVTKRYKRTRDFILVAVTYDLSTLTKIKETQLKFFAVKPYNYVKLSQDNSKALIKLYGDTTEFIVYDLERGSATWDGKKQEKFKSSTPLYRNASIAYDQSCINDFVLDNDGNIHFAYSLSNNNSSKFYYSYINTKDNICSDYLISSDFSYNVWDPTITCFSDKKVMVSSMFRELNGDNKIGLKGGVLNCVFDNSKSAVISKKFSEYLKFNPDGNKNNNPKNLNRVYEIDESFIFGNSTILIGHKRINAEFGQTTTEYTMVFYSDIFILKVNQNSEIEFYKELPYSARIGQGIGANYLIKQFIDVVNENNLYLFHNESEGTTKIIESNDKESQLVELWAGGKNFVCNKLNLMDGSNKRTIIELPPKNRFNPIPEANYALSRPFGSCIFNKFNKVIYIPILWGYSMERFLKVTID